jgi:hypothetical protein
MKKTLLLACVVVAISSCNSNQPAANTATAAPVADTTVAEKIDYAYLPAGHVPDYWDRGDQKNIALVLKSLKAFENGNVDESLSAFADTLYWTADGINGKYSKADMKKIFTDVWSKVSAMKIAMEDYEAVVSKDKKENYVSLWYKHTTTYKSGKVDSTFTMDDLRIENGKITVLDEKSRKYPAAKK